MDVRVFLRLTPADAHRLRARAARDGETVSETIREALYRTYGIGDLTDCSSLTPPPCRSFAP